MNYYYYYYYYYYECKRRAQSTMQATQYWVAHAVPGSATMRAYTLGTA